MIIGVIPARYGSTRFPGKPIENINNKPMIYWIYRQLKKVAKIDKVLVALDDDKIAKCCEKYDMEYIYTSKEHSTHIERLHEVSEKIEADYYINVNGDEPLITAKAIEEIIPQEIVKNEIYVANMMTEIKDPVETVDTSKIKITVDTKNYGMYMARYPIPFPKGRGDVIYNKFVGVQCFNKKALDFVKKTPRGYIESCEDIDEYRFLENGQKIKFIKADVDNISVDTKKDLERVDHIMRNNKELYND